MPINPIRLPSQMIIPCVTPDRQKKSRVNLGNNYYTFSIFKKSQITEFLKKIHRIYCFIDHEVNKDLVKSAKYYAGGWVALGVSGYAGAIHPLLTIVILVGYWGYLASFIKDPGEEFFEEYYKWFPSINKMMFREMVRKNPDMKEYFKRNPEINKEIEQDEELMEILQKEPKLVRIFISRPDLYDHIKTNYKSLYREILQIRYPNLRRKLESLDRPPISIDIEEID